MTSSCYPVELGAVDPMFMLSTSICDEWVGDEEYTNEDGEDDLRSYYCTLPMCHGGSWHVAHDRQGCVIMTAYAPPLPAHEVNDGL